MNTPLDALAGEASEQITPAFSAADPRLLICSTESLLRQPNRAASARLGAIVRLVYFRERLFFLARSRRRVLRTEQPFSERLFLHWCTG